MIVNAAEKLVSSSLNYVFLDDQSVEAAKAKFGELQQDGVIKSGVKFEDEIWYTTDEYSNVGLHFSFNRFAYDRFYKEIVGLSFADFISHIKCFLMSVFGRRALGALQDVLRDLRYITEQNPTSINGAMDDFSIFSPWLCAEFFALLSGSLGGIEELEHLARALDVYAEFKCADALQSRRTLADFDTYFKFDEIIKEFWNSPLSREERLFFYPLYLWWEITAVLPLRPREFLVTPRNCLGKTADGVDTLTLRRNKIKGGANAISYKILDDYYEDTYQVPPRLAEEVRKYLEFTADFESTELETLFVTDPHYKKWGRIKQKNSRFLTYANMNTILRYFFAEVVCGRHGLTVVYDREDKHLADNEIGYVYLGDTRHIAFINAIKEGVTPDVVMRLGGHKSMAMSSHYYGNLEKYLDCKTYRLYRRLASGDSKYRIAQGTSNLAEIRSAAPLSDGGRCVSKLFAAGDIGDCLNAVGDHGEIGYCPACTKYRRNGASLLGHEDIFKRNLQKDCDMLMQAVDAMRKGKGCVEHIGEAMLRIRASVYSYEEYLLEKRNAEGR